eukprot:Gb_25659 [translate_table: standard]
MFNCEERKWFFNSGAQAGGRDREGGRQGAGGARRKVEKNRRRVQNGQECGRRELGGGRGQRATRGGFERVVGDGECRQKAKIRCKEGATDGRAEGGGGGKQEAKKAGQTLISRGFLDASKEQFTINAFIDLL